jgi:ABC-type antimicrobial peptide transport system permease subunit
VTQLTAAFAGPALLLAASGIYGLFSYMVTERRREIAIRMAFGAEQSRILADLEVRSSKLSESSRQASTSRSPNPGRLRAHAQGLQHDNRHARAIVAPDRSNGGRNPMRVAAVALGAFGVLAVMLAATGIHGVVSYAVMRRRREIAIRVAVGATRRSILQLVLRRVATLVAEG